MGWTILVWSERLGMMLDIGQIERSNNDVFGELQTLPQAADWAVITQNLYTLGNSAVHRYLAILDRS